MAQTRDELPRMMREYVTVPTNQNLMIMLWPFRTKVFTEDGFDTLYKEEDVIQLIDAAIKAGKQNTL